MQKGITIFRWKIFVSQCQKIRRGTLRCFKKFRASLKFMHKKEISLNSVEKSLSRSADKILRRTLLCCERFLVSKSFKQRKTKLDGFVEKFFNSQDRKNFAREPLCFRRFLEGKNVLWTRRGGWGYHDLPSKLLSHCTQIFHWRTLWCFRKILLLEIVKHRRGAEHHGFVEIFCFTGPKRKAS